ncbi:MAG: P1 family peptidase [Acidimicrobiia bacterium]
MRGIRQLGVVIGRHPPGPHNAITDVPGVLVGHSTLVADQPRTVRTGITAIFPRADIWTDYAACGWFNLNGNGEMTGIPWIDESGLLGSPIGITNTHQVGLVRDTMIKVAVERGVIDGFMLPVVAETYDGWLSDIDAFALTEEHARRALEDARSGDVLEGNVGGGTGMICHEFKGGIGTSSRVVDTAMHSYTVGVLVQANYGSRADLRVDGVPVGRHLSSDEVPIPWEQERSEGSIIIVIATDAPVVSDQCRRLARRAAIALARVGGVAHNGSGDIFIAFSTGNHHPQGHRGAYELRALPPDHLDALFAAVVNATEESILNALCAAETMTGFKGRTAHALPLERVAELMEKFGRPPAAAG